MFNFGSKAENISVDQIQSEMKNGAILVDIRNTDAFAQGHIKGAVNIPLRVMPFNMDKLDKSKTIIVICYVGGSSVMASKLLTKAGYTVKNVIGGMQAWNGELVK